jgi:hypothetical protein
MSTAKTASLSHSDVSQPALLTNRQAWAHLAKEIERLTAQCCGVGALTISGTAFPNPVLTLGSLPALGKLLQQRQKTSQIYLQMGRLLDAFERDGVIITPKLLIPQQGSLDLLVRFPVPPKKVNFAIALRAKPNAKVVYHEAKEALFLRRKGGGLRRWEPDHLKRLPLQELWLRNNRIEIFGPSSKDKNRPLIKLLALTGDTTVGQHSEHLYTTVGNERVLLIRRHSSTYVMHESQLIPFITGWLEQLS